ncbi:MAG: MotA/TolQ/ExbB proton channel family protein [Wenzhouxiangellaceae bacterium]|nr:MotA/TolQ/ExbB proton channel family protein [Wenzhouxiangellaceae bacterium]
MFNGLLKDLAYFFEVGGYVMPPLMLSTVVLWFSIGYRFSILTRGSVRSVRRLIERIAAEPQPRRPKGLLDRAVLRGLQVVERGPEPLRRHLDDEFADLEQTTRRFGKLIFAIVAVAPLMGLLGTVVGMIETFDSLGDMSLFAQSGGIAGGISQALFTTQMGLAVAIPGLVVGSMLDRKASAIRHELAQIKDLLCAGPARESTQ